MADTRPGILEIARRSQVSPSHVSKIFGGTRQPSFETAAKIAKAAGISLDKLYTELQSKAA